MSDSLKFVQRPDGSFSIEWDPNDPKWSWMNELTDEQVRVIVQQALWDYEEE